MLDLADDDLDLVEQGQDNLEIGLDENIGVLLGVLEGGDDIGQDVVEVDLEADDGGEENLGVEGVEVDDLVVFVGGEELVLFARHGWVGALELTDDLDINLDERFGVDDLGTQLLDDGDDVLRAVLVVGDSGRSGGKGSRDMRDRDVRDRGGSRWHGRESRGGRHLDRRRRRGQGREVGESWLGVTSAEARRSSAGRIEAWDIGGEDAREVLGDGDDRHWQSAGTVEGGLLGVVDGQSAGTIEGGLVMVVARSVHGNGNGRANRESGGQGGVGELHFGGLGRNK